MKKTLSKAKPGTSLYRIGVWATGWWAVSGIYVVIVVICASYYYVSNAQGWRWAITQAYSTNQILWWSGLIILIGWIIGSMIWIRSLKKHHISIATALKDLVLTIRR